MKRITTFKTLVILISVSCSYISNPGKVLAEKKTGENKKKTEAAADVKFLENAARGGISEVEMGKLAQEKGQSEQVKDFGKTLVRDHSEANEKLKDIAADKSITVPGDMAKQQKDMLAKLGKLSGDSFDKEFAKHMTMDHKKDIAEFEKESKSGKDAELKAFAANTLPTLKEHLQLAEKLQKK
jgi:putative membrane protein